MNHTGLNILLILVLVASLLGQAMADSNVSICSETLQANNVSDVEYINEQPAEADNCCDTDCCESSCFCAFNACSVLAYVTTNYSSISDIEFSSPNYQYQHQHPVKTRTSVYRPPIFTS